MSIQMTLKHVFGVQKRERYNENLRMKKKHDFPHDAKRNFHPRTNDYGKLSSTAKKSFPRASKN